MEAKDIHTHLKPLRRHLEALEAVEFPELKPRLRPLLHVVCLIWATCKSYCSPGRLTVLLQEICNLLIQQVGPPGSPLTPWRLGGMESQRRVKWAFSGQGNNYDPQGSLSSYFTNHKPARPTFSVVLQHSLPFPLPKARGLLKGRGGELQPPDDLCSQTGIYFTLFF